MTTLGTNTGHGHVWARPDGVKARCGGPGLCKECSREQVAWNNCLPEPKRFPPMPPITEPTQPQADALAAEIKRLADDYADDFAVQAMLKPASYQTADDDLSNSAAALHAAIDRLCDLAASAQTVTTPNSMFGAPGTRVQIEVVHDPLAASAEQQPVGGKWTYELDEGAICRDGEVVFYSAECRNNDHQRTLNALAVAVVRAMNSEPVKPGPGIKTKGST